MRRVKDFLYKGITYKIRGACFKVWNEFGATFRENIIEKALMVELEKLGLSVERQKRINVFYKDRKIGYYIADLVVNNVVLVELKSKPRMTRLDERQFWIYLKGSEYKLGLLVNFGPGGLEFKRRVFDKARLANKTNYQRNSAFESA